MKTKIYKVDNTKKSDIKGFWLDGNRVYVDQIEIKTCKGKAELKKGIKALAKAREIACFYVKANKGYIVDNKTGAVEVLTGRLELKRVSLKLAEIKHLLAQYKGLTIYRLARGKGYIIEIYYKEIKNIKLYHYTDIEGLKYIRPDYIGKNIFTQKELQTSSFKRAFWYTKRRPEYLLKSCNILYIAEVDRDLIYNLKTDRLGLIDKSKIKGLDVIDYNILFRNIRAKGYIGALYSLGYDIVTTFKSVKINKEVNLK